MIVVGRLTGIGCRAGVGGWAKNAWMARCMDGAVDGQPKSHHRHTHWHVWMERSPAIQKRTTELACNHARARPKSKGPHPPTHLQEPPLLRAADERDGDALRAEAPRAPDAVDVRLWGLVGCFFCWLRVFCW